MTFLSNANAISSDEINTGDIGHSLRFRSSASAYASKTFASAGNRKTWTWSGWVKRGTLEVLQSFYSVGDGTPADGYANLYFTASNTLRFSGTPNNSTNDVDVSTTAVFRDPSASYHILFSIDTTQSVAADRVKLWVNGVSRALTLTTSPALNADLQFNRGGSYYHRFGMRIGFADSYLDGYLSRVCFVDGQALTPSSFGYLNTESNEWVSKTQFEVKAVVDAGGANSFMLEFKNATSLTTLGYDNSSKGNNWTCNNFSLTAGATYDHMLDVPGNSYATINGIDYIPAGTRSNGNLSVITSAGTYTFFRSTIPLPNSGKFRVSFFSPSGTDANNGVAFIMAYAGTAPAAFPAAGSYGILSSATANLVSAGTNIVTGRTAINTTEEISLAIDVDAGKAWVGRGATWYDSSGGTTGNPATGANPTFTGSFAGYFVGIQTTVTTSHTYHVNYGQQPFINASPAGFLALCQANLSDSGTVIVSGSFTGNANADGPCIWMNGVPKTLTINSNAVTFGTHADKLATGFKIRTASTSYNSTGTNTWTATIDSNLQNIFKYNNGEVNP